MIERRFTIRVEAAHRTGIPDWNEENHRLISPKARLLESYAGADNRRGLGEGDGHI